jgi:hypothetical protein
MKISFVWLDRKCKTHWPINPHFKKYWSGQIWTFSVWKWSLTIDFRKQGFLGYIKKAIWTDRLKNRIN